MLSHFCIFTHLSQVIHLASAGVSACKLCFVLYNNFDCGRLSLCNRCWVPIICWQTHCCMAVRRFGAVTSAGPAPCSSEKKQPREGKQTLLTVWDLSFHWNMPVCHWHVTIFQDSIRIQSCPRAANSESFPSLFLPTHLLLIHETQLHHSDTSRGYTDNKTNNQCAHYFVSGSN